MRRGRSEEEFSRPRSDKVIKEKSASRKRQYHLFRKDEIIGPLKIEYNSNAAEGRRKMEKQRRRSWGQLKKGGVLSFRPGEKTAAKSTCWNRKKENKI